MNYSRQRALIQEVLLQNPVHPTADRVFELVRRQLPNISLGTVYRNLNQLSGMGALQKISIPGGPDHFDGRTDNHFHLHCQCCGQLYDLPKIPLDGIEYSLGHLGGFTVTEVQLYITGVCPECNKANRKKESA